MASPSGNSEVFARELARLLREQRALLGYSKLALAQKAGIDQRTVTFIEEGVNAPSVTTLYALCEALEISAGEIATAAELAVRGRTGKKPKRQ